jgi:hypothetical protein
MRLTSQEHEVQPERWPVYRPKTFHSPSSDCTEKTPSPHIALPVPDAHQNELYTLTQKLYTMPEQQMQILSYPEQQMHATFPQNDSRRKQML